MRRRDRSDAVAPLPCIGYQGIGIDVDQDALAQLGFARDPHIADLMAPDRIHKL